jgi:hypothetical protein
MLSAASVVKVVAAVSTARGSPIETAEALKICVTIRAWFIESAMYIRQPAPILTSTSVKPRVLDTQARAAFIFVAQTVNWMSKNDNLSEV